MAYHHVLQHFTLAVIPKALSCEIEQAMLKTEEMDTVWQASYQYSITQHNQMDWVLAEQLLCLGLTPT